MGAEVRVEKDVHGGLSEDEENEGMKRIATAIQ